MTLAVDALYIRNTEIDIIKVTHDAKISIQRNLRERTCKGS